MGLQHCHIQDPFFLQFQHSSAKQIVSSHAHYIFIAHLQWLTNNFRTVHTNNQIHFQKGNTIPCSLAQQEIGLPYGLTTLPYPRPFSSCNFNIPQPNKLLVFMHIIFSKLCILTVQVIFIYSRVQRKRKYHYLRMHPFNIPNFPNAIQISNDFNQCANIHGHIHTQCTLALISSFPHFMTSTFPWCVGA
jgi:hypothetical protein